MDFINRFNNRIDGTFSTALQLSSRHPRLASFMMKTLLNQRRAKERRTYWSGEGVHVPPVLIISITHRCNLRCKGCYANVFRTFENKELTKERFNMILTEARELGISIIFLAGGEPLLRKDIIEVTADFRDIIFPFFTNGVMINDEWIARFRRQKNLIPILSLEGHREQTDDRRGEGVYDRFLENTGKMKGKGLLWGVSVTLTRNNFDTVVDASFVRSLSRNGCRLFFYIEYVPVAEGTEDLVISIEQREGLIRQLEAFREDIQGLFFGFPGDEEQYGGCLAAGRGFAHINPQGRLEPCPFAPYSDTDLNEISLKEALSSELMEAIRNEHDKLSETMGGCALWQNREWVQSLLLKDLAPAESI